MCYTGSPASNCGIFALQIRKSKAQVEKKGVFDNIWRSGAIFGAGRSWLQNSQVKVLCAKLRPSGGIILSRVHLWDGSS